MSTLLNAMSIDDIVRCTFDRPDAQREKALRIGLIYRALMERDEAVLQEERSRKDADDHKRGQMTMGF